MKKFCFIFVFLLSYKIMAQGKINEMPSFLYNLENANLPTKIFTLVSNQRIKNSNISNGGIQVGQSFSSNYNFKNNSRVDTINQYEGIYRLCIKSDSAFSIDLIIDSLFLEDEEEVWFYNQDQTQIYGPYTNRHQNYQNNKLYSPNIKGEKIIIEYLGGLNNNNAMRIERVSHLMGSNSSASITPDCLENVKCSIGNGWQNEANSIVKIRVDVSGIIGWASGVMINWNFSSNNIYKPYMITAFHNLDVLPLTLTGFGDGMLDPTERDLSNFRFYFDSNPLDCNDDNEWQENDKFIVGASIKTANNYNDIALLQLNSNPSTIWNVNLAGFSISNDLPTSGACIHTPAKKDIPGNVSGIFYNRNKKISISLNSTGSDIVTNYLSSNGSTKLKVKFVDTSLPDGSSGSPFFDQNGNVCGILSFGHTNCYNFSESYTLPNGTIYYINYGPNEPSTFGKISENFNYESDFDADGINETMGGFLCPDGCSNGISGIPLNSILCNNNEQDFGETGVDCGGGCPDVCPAGGGNSNLPHCTNCNSTKTYHGRNFASNSTRRVRDNIVFTHRFAECNLNNDTQIGGGSNIFKAGQNIDFDCVDIIEESDFRIEACEIHLFNCLLGFMDERHGNFDIEEIEFPIQPKETKDENGKITTKKFELIPNPNNGEFTLNYYENSQNKKISIYNSLGQLIYFNENKPNQSYLNIDLKHLNSGVYFCQIVIENEVHKTKLVIQK